MRIAMQQHLEPVRNPMQSAPGRVCQGLHAGSIPARHSAAAGKGGA